MMYHFKHRPIFACKTSITEPSENTLRDSQGINTQFWLWKQDSPTLHFCHIHSFTEEFQHWMQRPSMATFPTSTKGWKGQICSCMMLCSRDSADNWTESKGVRVCLWTWSKRPYQAYHTSKGSAALFFAHRALWPHLNKGRTWVSVCACVRSLCDSYLPFAVLSLPLQLDAPVFRVHFSTVSDGHGDRTEEVQTWRAVGHFWAQENFTTFQCVDTKHTQNETHCNRGCICVLWPWLQL